MLKASTKIAKVIHDELFNGFLILGLLTEGGNTYWTVHNDGMDKLHRCDELHQARVYCKCAKRLLTDVVSNIQSIRNGQAEYSST